MTQAKVLFLGLFIMSLMTSCQENNGTASTKNKLKSDSYSIKGTWVETRSSGQYKVLFDDEHRFEIKSGQKSFAQKYSMKGDTIMVNEPGLRKYVIEKLTKEEMHLRPIDLYYNVLFFKRLED